MIAYSIIIPNFNGANLLPNCLSSIFQSIKSCPLTQFEIILVDNASADNSIAIFKNFAISHKISYKIIKLSQNFGFATAVNRGIELSRYPYLCLINNDIKLDKNWFKFLSHDLKKYPSVACFCGTIKNIDGHQIESRGINFDYSGKCLQVKNNSSGPVWGSSGAAVIYKKEILKLIGLFDEKYFAYIEDVDLAFRLHRLHYQTFFNTKAICYHLGGATSNKMGNFRAKQTFRNWIYFIFKNYTLMDFLKYFPQIFLERLRNLSYLLKSSIKL